MSSKGTIFLTRSNEHVYDETNDWSIVFEINKASIERVELRRYNSEHKAYTELLNLNENGYLVLQTRSNYKFIDSFKLKLGNYEDWSLYNNSLNCLCFESWEIDELHTDEIEIVKPIEIRIYIKKDSEWYGEYINHLKKVITTGMADLNKKLELCFTIELKINEQ